MKVCLSFFIFTSHSYFLNILRIENGDMVNAKRHLGIFTELDPVKPAMLGIWVYLENQTFMPAFLVSKFRIKVDLYLITDLNRLGH